MLGQYPPHLSPKSTVTRDSVDIRGASAHRCTFTKFRLKPSVLDNRCWKHQRKSHGLTTKLKLKMYHCKTDARYADSFGDSLPQVDCIRTMAAIWNREGEMG